MLALIEALCDRIADALENVGRNIDGVSRAVFRRKAGDKSLSNTQTCKQSSRRSAADGDLLTKVRESLVSINRVLTYHTTLDGKDKQRVRDARARAELLYSDVVGADRSGDVPVEQDKFPARRDARPHQPAAEPDHQDLLRGRRRVPAADAGRVDLRHELHDMPELDWEFGYMWAVGLMIASAILPYLYFKRRGWL